MANLRQALQYASKNPDSAFAKALSQRIVNGQADAEAESLGLDLTPIKTKFSGTQRIEQLRGEAEIAEVEAEQAGSFVGKAKTFGKEFVGRLGRLTGITPTAEKISAGIAPFIVPDEELPTVVEELAGGVETPQPGKAKEFTETALDLPLISLGLSKNISRAFSKQVSRMTPKMFSSFVDKPLLEFLPQSVRDALKVDVSTPVKEASQELKKKRGLARIEQTTKETEEAVGQILQGKPDDIARGKRALSLVDTKDVKTYKELNQRITEKIDTIKGTLDNFLDQQTGIFKKNDLTTTTKVGETTVRQNYVTDAIKQLKELYTKIKDPQSLAKITNLEKKLAQEGLTVKELNNLAREYGSEFGRKAFSKLGDPLTSINAQAFENTRKGIKTTARGKIEGNVPQELDKQMSDLLNTRILTDKMETKVNALWQRVQKRGVMEEIARKVADVVNIATLRTFSGFLGRMLPSNVGLKTMNSIDIENLLSKNLKKIDELLKLENDQALIEGIEKIIRSSQLEA